MTEPAPTEPVYLQCKIIVPAVNDRAFLDRFRGLGLLCTESYFRSGCQIISRTYTGVLIDSVAVDVAQSGLIGEMDMEYIPTSPRQIIDWDDINGRGMRWQSLKYDRTDSEVPDTRQ